MGSIKAPSAVKNDFIGLGSFEGLIKYYCTISGITMLYSDEDVELASLSSETTVDYTVGLGVGEVVNVGTVGMVI